MLQPLHRLMLKPRQLRLVQEIAESGQLQQAADAMGMTQPAASRMLAETERQLGASLFLRQPKGMEPTEAGMAVLRRAQVILREMGSMATELRSLQLGLGGSVRVGSVTGPAVRYLVTAVREVKEEAPGADITVDVLPSRDLLTLLVAGEMDFVLARVLPEFDSRDFNILPLQDENVTIMVRAGHPLARSPVVTLAELRDFEWIMQQRGAPIREATLAAFGDFGLNGPSNVVNSPSTLLTLAYLAQSDAVAPMSVEVAELLIRPPIGAGFTTLPLANEIRMSRYYLLDLRHRTPSPLALRLRERLQAGGLAGAGGSWLAAGRPS